jgi:alpha-beta hydrolase superfamily lysophospholipase
MVLALSALAVMLAACSPSTDRRIIEGEIEAGADPAFYTPPTPLPPGQPGEIVRQERLFSAPDQSIAWRVLFHSTDVTGADTVLSGVIIAPDSPAPPSGRSIVAWGHPTTGAAAECAPSRGVDPFDSIEGLKTLLDDGYAVAAADYPGLGVAGQNTYLVGTSEANSVLDSVRVAQHIPETGVTVNSDVLLWGHSQGGHAVLFAAQDASTYAPELKVKAVAVAAPAADLGTLFDDDIPDASGVTLGSYAFAAFESVYAAKYPGLSLNSVLTDPGAAATPGMAQLCLISQHTELHDQAVALVGNYTRSDPVTTEPWATILAENTPGAAPLGVPLYVAQGATDTLVLPSATQQFVSSQCAGGQHLTFESYPDTGHGLIALKAVPAVTAFFDDVLAGTPPASTC